MDREGTAEEFRSGVPRWKACRENGGASDHRRVPLEGTRIADRAYKRSRDYLAGEADTKSQASYFARYPRGRNPWSRQRLALRKPRSRPERTRSLLHSTCWISVARGAWPRRWAKILCSQSSRGAQEWAQ